MTVGPRTQTAGLRDADRAELCVIVPRDCGGEHGARHRGDGHRRFALAVDLRKLRSQCGERRLAILDVHRCAAADDALEVVEPRAAKRGMRDQALDHGRRGEEAGIRPAREERHDLARIEATRIRHDVDRGAQHMRQDIHPRAMRQRRGVQDRVAGRNGLDVGEETLAHRMQVAMRQHRALGTARRAAGIEEPRGIGGRDCGGLVARHAVEKPVVFARCEFDDALERLAGESSQRRVPRCIDEYPARAGVLQHVRELAWVQLAVDRHCA